MPGAYPLQAIRARQGKDTFRTRVYWLTLAQPRLAADSGFAFEGMRATWQKPGG